MKRGPDADSTPGGDDGPSDGGSLRQMGRYGGHGITMGAATALFAWLGHLLDDWIGTGPLFVLLGAGAGFAGGFYAMYRDLVLRPERGSAEEGDHGGRDG